MSYSQWVTQLEETLKGIDQWMEDFMTEIYTTVDTKMAENNAQLQAMMFEIRTLLGSE